MRDDWYLRKGGKISGPFTRDELKRARAVGRLTPETKVRCGLTGEWMAAKEFSGLFPPTRLGPVGRLANWFTQIPLAAKIAGGCLVGTGLLVSVVFVAFEVGRRQFAPAATAEQFDKVEFTRKAEAKPAIQPAPVVPEVAQNVPLSNENRVPLPVAQVPAPVARAVQPPVLKPPVFPLAAGRTRRSRMLIGGRRREFAVPVAPAPAVPMPVAPTANNPVAAITATLVSDLTSTAGSPVPPERSAVIAVRPVMRAAGASTFGSAVAQNDPAKKVPAKDTDLRALEASALHLATAKDALALYDHFAATRTLTAEQKTTFDTARATWVDRTKQDLVRLGTKWVISSEAQQAHDEANQLVQQAHEMIKILNFSEARKALEKASRVDPNSITADFTLGLLNSITPPQYRHPPTAAKHFHAVLQRIPGYVPALNNLAIAEIRQEKYAEAVKHLREAAERAPTAADVTQNLGRFVSEAKLGRIRPRPTILADATRVYSKTITAKEGTASELKRGWTFIPLIKPKEERESAAGPPAPGATSEIWDCAQGTGFVVEPHYVLTCRHVVDDIQLGQADRVELIDPTDAAHQRRLSATCVAISESDDLALIQCDQLNVAPVSLAAAVPPRGTEILLIGFPGGSDFGLGLKTTRGIITAMPGGVAKLRGPAWNDFSRKVWYDAASSHGASGGAVCDDRCNVIAIHTTGYRPGDDPSNAKYAGGVPIMNAVSFIRQSVPVFEPRTSMAEPLKWTEVDGRISPSVMLIIVGYRKMTIMVVAGKQEPATGARRDRRHLHSQSDNIYDDRACSACNGISKIRCRACRRGVVDGEVTQNLVARTPFGNWHSQDTVPIEKACPVCHGTGYVRCPYCVNGVDPTVH